MGLELFAQIVGIISIFILFCIEFYISVFFRSYLKSGRAALLWTSIYVLFLFVLRLFSVLKIGTLSDLRIVSGFASLLPLLAVCIQLNFERKFGKIEEKVKVIIKPVKVE